MSEIDTAFNDLLKTVARENPLRCLFLENEELSVKYLVDPLQREGVEVLWAKSPEAADRKLEGGGPDVVVADVQLGEQEKGSDWIARQRVALSKAELYILTGYERSIQNRDLLKALGVTILTKGDDEEEDRLLQRLRMKARERALLEVTRRLEAAAQQLGLARKQPTATGEGVTSIETQLGSTVKEVFLSWAEANANDESGALVLRGRSYRVADLAMEVREGSPVGTRMLELFAQDMRRLYGI